MRDQASLHEKAVQKVARESLTIGRARRGRQSRSARVNTRVRSVKVHPLVWKRAMQLAKRDARRIEVISSTEVWVR